MRNCIFRFASCFFVLTLLSCDPSKVFTHSKTLNICIENSSCESIFWESNWGKISNGEIGENNGITNPGDIQTIWDNIEIPYEVSDVYKYFIDMINNNNRNPYFTIYIYDNIEQRADYYLYKWSLDKSSDSFFLITYLVRFLNIQSLLREAI